ncbi:UNVERIFIED_CONTAM: hypothetical protein HDU68_012419 [Siphonaria sp. JEL0065]|nr:hypothetical protein HDU68_012419 [Siphonaria sp. JEL0065]
MVRSDIQKILIANRGEIACRVIATCKLLGISTVAVYSDADAHSLHVQNADESVYIGSPIATESYLNVDKIIQACKQTGADAVHPGYGFLSENAEFARKCTDNGIIFIGPRPESILAIGDKISSKVLLAAKAPQVPLLPGYNGDDQTVSVLVKEALKIGFPVLLKASAGGGGKGMRIVRTQDQLSYKLQEEIKSAQGESQRSFGDSRLLIEKYIETARHIEIQIFGDMHGDAVTIFERECSIQRRHQKIIEECPSPFLTPELRKSMTTSAVAIANLISYVGAGTVEFIVDGVTGKYYFLEVNTRLQVEHPVTEAVTGLDLVAMQIWVAQGGKLADLLARNGGIQMKGHAIECRIYAEDPANDFFPATGVITKFTFPSGPGIRSDTGIQNGSEITSFYDPLISKVVVHGETRKEAVAKMLSVLRKTQLFGLTAHNIGFLCKILEAGSEFENGMYDTGVVGRLMTKHEVSLGLQGLIEGIRAAVIYGWILRRLSKAAGPYKRIRSGFRNVPYSKQSIQFLSNGKGPALVIEYEVVSQVEGVTKFQMNVGREGKTKRNQREILWAGTVDLTDSFVEQQIVTTFTNGSLCILVGGLRQTFVLSQSDNEGKVFVHSQHWNGSFLSLSINNPFEITNTAGGGQDGVLITPMPCRIISVNSVTGSSVKLGDTILTIESMKMETKIRATIEGTVKVNVKEGDMVKAGEIVAQITSK